MVENIVGIEDIWEVLDSKYGDSIDIVNLVIKDIEKFQLPRNDQEIGLFNLLHILKKGVQNLTAIHARTGFANAYTVKLLETKLPKRALAKWVEKENNQSITSQSPPTPANTTGTAATKKSRFDQLLHFLKQARKQAECDDSIEGEGRSTKGR